MNCRQRSSSNDGDIINISSMLDVMFILIIFFLVKIADNYTVYLPGGY